jgi:hypothetical protein
MCVCVCVCVCVIRYYPLKKLENVNYFSVFYLTMLSVVDITESNSVITLWKGLNILCRYKRVLL